MESVGEGKVLDAGEEGREATMSLYERVAPSIS